MEMTCLRNQSYPPLKHLALGQIINVLHIVFLNTKGFCKKVRNILADQSINLEILPRDLLLQEFSVCWHTILQMARVKWHVDTFQWNGGRPALKLDWHRCIFEQGYVAPNKRLEVVRMPDIFNGAWRLGQVVKDGSQRCDGTELQTSQCCEWSLITRKALHVRHKRTALLQR